MKIVKLKWPPLHHIFKNGLVNYVYHRLRHYGNNTTIHIIRAVKQEIDSL